MFRNFFAISLSLLTFSLAAEDRYVVAIHGLTLDSRTMSAVCHTLSCRNDEAYLWNYPSTKGTICSHGQQLYYILQDIAACRPGKPIDFVTHSIGALILRQALNIEGCPEEAKIGRTVMFAPPNQGSRLAREWKGFPPVTFCVGTKIGCELMTYDAATIHAIGPFPPTMQVLVIAGYKGSNMLFNEPNDGFIAVNETALDTPYYFQSYRVSHGRLLTNPEALELMAYFIDHGGCESEDRGCESEDIGCEPEGAESAPEPTN